MTSKSPEPRPATQDAPRRRDLLKGAALAGTAAAAGGAAVLPALAVESPEEQAKPRYRETAHVQRFYYLNRL